MVYCTVQSCIPPGYYYMYTRMLLLFLKKILPIKEPNATKFIKLHNSLALNCAPRWGAIQIPRRKREMIK